MAGRLTTNMVRNGATIAGTYLVQTVLDKEPVYGVNAVKPR